MTPASLAWGSPTAASALNGPRRTRIPSRWPPGACSASTPRPMWPCALMPPRRCSRSRSRTAHQGAAAAAVHQAGHTIGGLIADSVLAAVGAAAGLRLQLSPVLHSGTALHPPAIAVKRFNHIHGIKPVGATSITAAATGHARNQQEGFGITARSPCGSAAPGGSGAVGPSSGLVWRYQTTLAWWSCGGVALGLERSMGSREVPHRALFHP
jgi:hypothetical protein